MERILYNQLYEYLTATNILSEHQFGFRNFHSTASALLDCTNDWYINMDRKLFILVVFIDLKKTFDTFDHEILLQKLMHVGITGNAFLLLKSYLTECAQICEVNGSISCESSVKYRVPQGSILGPLFFLLYINDLPTCLNKTKPRLFADDTNITAAGECLHDIENAVNSDLENLRQWLLANKLSLNVAKTDFQIIGTKPMRKKASAEQLKIGLLWAPMSPRLYAKFGDIGRYWAILEKIFKIHGDFRRHWAILGDIGRYWVILSNIGYIIWVLAWDTMITVSTEYHCIPLFKTMYYPFSINMFTS